MEYSCGGVASKDWKEISWSSDCETGSGLYCHRRCILDKAGTETWSLAQAKTRVNQMVIKRELIINKKVASIGTCG